MEPGKKLFFKQYSAIAFSLLITLCLIRVYEYFSIASKSFVAHSYRFELEGLLYDIWLWLIYCFVFFIPFFLLYRIKEKIATVTFHVINIILIICYIALIITFSERNTPFDHELFTRNGNDSMVTVKQMMTGGFKVYSPFVLYTVFYFFIYYKVFNKIKIPQALLWPAGLFSLASVALIKYSNPSPSWFRQNAAYYLTSNKLCYWLQDTYRYFTTKNNYVVHKLNNKELEAAVDLYQQNQPFEFTSKEFPLLHKNNEPDVLGNFFNFKKEKPNIVILVVEGLSRDFSGENAYAGSFTPFLDSLSKKSLVWDNFLSTAPGTFAAHPSISGSLPYAKNGFSIMNVMPDHLSLIKILKANGYYTNFMIGFNPDFDNMGGYIRLQGTDFILSRYPAKYKEMGVGKEGWSMGYPDDALYSRSFEVLDSINKKPYLSIYHTGTTHMPYLFEQSPIYSALFDKKIKTMKVSADIKRTLKETKEVLLTFMFSDDCLKKFFEDYSKRTEYDNTIFFIVGDHHIGSFPSTGDIDDYHVPFIIYSPMLKKSQRFLSVNSHLNITPTILAMMNKNFSLNYWPEEVHWMGSVMDTCTSFRNIHSMPFMWWSRDINDYLYKDYFLSEDQLYKLTPDLLEEKYENDSLKNYITRLRENFKVINSYVCENNKIYPGEKNFLPGNKKLLEEFSDTSSKLFFSRSPDTSLAPFYKIPEGYKYLYVEFSALTNLPGKETNDHPTIRFALIDNKNNDQNYLYYSKRDIVTLSKGNFQMGKWNAITATDLFTLDDYKNVNDLNFETAIYTDSIPINLKMKDVKIRVYGIK